MSDNGYFVGTVALINSLRLTGNAGPVVVLDLGLTSGQRQALKNHARIVSLGPETDRHPLLAKPYSNLLEPSGLVVLIDSDMIVTRSLGDILELAAKGRICAYPDPNATRWVPEWHDRLQLRSALRRSTYVNSGFVAFSAERSPRLLPRWWEACELVPRSEIGARGVFNAGDQDVLNALLMSEIRDPVTVLPGTGMALGSDARIEDMRTLACTSEGRQTTVLHYPDRPKPWQRSGWFRLTGTAYVRLMPRLLFGDDVAVRLQAEQVAAWLQPTLKGKLLLNGLTMTARALRTVIRRAPGPIRERVARLRRRLA